MRRTVLTTTILTALGVALTGASTCGPQGPAARDFAAGSLVIPMDNCYQRRDSSTPAQSSQPNAGCTAAAGVNDGVLRAYGLVYFLLKHNVPVYWAIDNTKTSPTAPDLAVTASAGAAAQKMSWADGSFGAIAGLGAAINYIGGPFVIDAGDAATALALFKTDPDFARFRSEAIVDVHQVQAGFHAVQVRPLSGPPPKLAILNVTAPVNGKTSSNVMYQYAVAAGLSWPCVGNGDCAGGLGPSCSLSAVLAYLASPGGDTAIPQTCTPSGCTPGTAGCLCAPYFNTGASSGQIYDLLCGGDFIPPAGGTYADTQLAKGNYKLLWIPHWDTHGVTPTGSTDPNATIPLPPANASDTLAWQLKSIASFVNANNNLFVECLGIQALEGIVGQDNVNSNPYGIPATRFQTPTGILKWNGSNSSSSLLAPAHPNLQIGDFAYSLVSGAITTYYPDASKPVASAYLPAVQRLVTTAAPATTSPPAWDVSSTIQVTGADGSPRGTVAYMGGHDYSPSVGCTPSQGVPGGGASQCNSGYTAGTRIVLNTLFNLGFGCSDPNPPQTCNTGYLGACAQGSLKCAGGGGLQCVGPQPGALDCKTPGADANCNGIPDQDEAGCHTTSCANGDGTFTANGGSQSCYDGKSTDKLNDGVNNTSSWCKKGTRVCNAGAWGPCAGEQLPRPEVCNNIDDDCNGVVDDGQLCYGSYACTGGVCLPSQCGAETAQCPSGFQCLTSGGACTAVPCPSTACPAGKVCQSGACVDPCAGVTCGAGATCSGGQCAAGGCTLVGCGSNNGQKCVSGTCVADPCAGLSCPTGTFCRVGPIVGTAHVADCVRSCSYVGCPDGQTCGDDGFCAPTCSPACGAGQVCAGGTCAPDPCTGVACGAGQECHVLAGVPTCVDSACTNVSCPVGTCTAGQCVGGPVTPSVVTPVNQAKSSGGCGTGGGADLGALALLGLLFVGRRRAAPALAPARLARLARRAAPAALALLVAAASGCSKSSGSSCSAPQTACGADCADLQTSNLHCGVCGHGCNTAQGFQCAAGQCVLPTGNPHLVSVSPTSIASSTAPALAFTFDGLDAAHPASNMVVRLTGAVPAQEVPVTVQGNVAMLPAGAMNVTGETTGTIVARLVNGPTRLVSNPVQVQVSDAPAVMSLSPALAPQDQAATVAIDLQGLRFQSGATVSFGPHGGALQPLPTTFVGAGEVTATVPAPSGLKVGRYDVAVTNPGGAASPAVTFTVTDGQPTIGSVSGTKGSCVQGGGTFTGSLAGTYLYPDSVVHVSGNSITNSPLDTSCLNATDALGQCSGGQLRVSADLSTIPLGTYVVTVVNPGQKQLVSNAVNITVAASCP